MSGRTNGRSEQREIFLTSRPKGAASRSSSISIRGAANATVGEIAPRTFLRRRQRHILLQENDDEDGDIDKEEKTLSKFTFLSRTSMLISLLPCTLVLNFRPVLPRARAAGSDLPFRRGHLRTRPCYSATILFLLQFTLLFV